MVKKLSTFASIYLLASIMYVIFFLGGGIMHVLFFGLWTLFAHKHVMFEPISLYHK